MNTKSINIENKIQDTHPHRVLLNRFTHTHNIPVNSSLSTPFVHNTPREVRNLYLNLV